MEVEFERTSLYQQVWTSPITTLAKKYGLSDNGLRKVCAALAIPLPQRGHWAKVAAGHQLTTPPLPPTEGRVFFVCRLPEPDPEGTTALRRDATLQEQLAFEAAPENAIVVPAELVKPHRLVAAALPPIRAEIAKLQRSRDYVPPKRKPGAPWRISDMSSGYWKDYELRGVMELGDDVLPVRVSIGAVDRALRIWHALLQACEARGLQVVSAHRQVKIGDGTHWIGLRMSEKVDRVTKPSTWHTGVETASRQPTSCLRIFAIRFYETKFEETLKRPLEAQLNAILAWIHRTLASERTKRSIADEKRLLEENAAKVQEQARAAAAAEARLRDEDLQRLRAEQAAMAERERLLLAEAGAWRNAEVIRSYVAHLRAVGQNITPALADWLIWADGVANKLDPTTSRLK